MMFDDFEDDFYMEDAEDAIEELINESTDSFCEECEGEGLTEERLCKSCGGSGLSK
jgi:DnaJ-class molecular chaperone